MWQKSLETSNQVTFRRGASDKNSLDLTVHAQDKVSAVEVIKQSEMAASIQISETEAKLLSMAVDYWKGAMSYDSPLAVDLSDRLRDITADFDAVMERAEEQ